MSTLDDFFTDYDNKDEGHEVSTDENGLQQHIITNAEKYAQHTAAVQDAAQEADANRAAQERLHHALNS